jgi:hypothetical protein
MFAIEGAITIIVSLASILILPDFPATTPWLSNEEKAVTIYRLRTHSGSVDEKRGSVLHGLRMALLDYKVWLLSLIVILKTSAAAITAFIQTLVATFQYSEIESLLMMAPPYVFAAIVAIAVSISSDRFEERY